MDPKSNYGLSPNKNLILMVSRVGFEPTTPSLKGKCSTSWANGPIEELLIIFKKDKFQLIIYL